MARKPKQDDTAQSARITLSKANRFLELASKAERNRFDYECYVEAALIFGVAVFDHLARAFGRRQGFKEWIEQCQSQPLIEDLIRKRNYLLHERALGIVPSQQEDRWFLGNSLDEPSSEYRTLHENLGNQRHCPKFS